MGFKFNPLTGQLDIDNDSGAVAASETPFDATTSWGTASGGYYSLTVTAAVHSKGVNPIVKIYKEDGVDFVEIEVDQVKINALGDITIRVPEVPDLRFAGKLVVGQ